MSEKNPSSAFSQPVLTRIAPEYLFVGSEPSFGYFDGRVKRVFPEKLQSNGASLVTPWPPKHRKQLEMVLLQHPQFQLLCRISNSSQSSHVVLFDHVKQQAQTLPVGRQILIKARLSNGAWDGISAAGKLKLAKFQGDWQVLLPLITKTLSLSTELELKSMPLSLPSSCCGALMTKGWIYQQQHHGLTPAGELKLNYEPQVLSRMTAGYAFFAGESMGHHPWRWLMFNGDLNGRRGGLCLTDGLSGPFSGNAVWLDGVRHMLPPVQLTVDSTNRRLPAWRIISACGRVEGVFMPKVAVPQRGSLQRPYLIRTQLISGSLNLDVKDTTGNLIEIRQQPAMLGIER